jgi:hypothetical protein
MIDPADLFSSEGGFTKNVFFSYTTLLYYIYIPLSVQGFLLPFFHVLLFHQSCVMNKAREMLIRIQQ